MLLTEALQLEAEPVLEVGNKVPRARWVMIYGQNGRGRAETEGHDSTSKPATTDLLL